MDKPTCSTCQHWRGNSYTYAAPCAVGAYPGRVAFDMSCGQHQAHAAPTMQSHARGVVPPMAGVAVGVKKP